MSNKNTLNNIPTEVIQEIYQSIAQGVGEDYQEAEAHLDLETRISKPLLIWDLINRNLIRSFSEKDVLYSRSKRGMWEVLLLFEKKSNLLLSFMNDNRFKALKKGSTRKRPKYMDALLLTNRKLQSPVKQQRLFIVRETPDERKLLSSLLNSLCKNFQEHVLGDVKNHVLVVFSHNHGLITSLKAYMLDANLDEVESENWFDRAKPIMPNIIEKTSDIEVKIPSILKLTTKAANRIKKKGIVSLKTFDESEEDGKTD